MTTKITMTKKSIILMTMIALAAGILVIASQKAEAAALYYNPPQKQAKLGEVFAIDILLDSEGKDLNAVDLKVTAPSEFLKIKDWSEGGSIITYWAEKPKIDGEGNLVFQGVMVDGFQGKDGKLLTIRYEALTPGKTSISIKAPTAAYLNDGKGTKANLRYNGAAINILTERAEGGAVSIIDTTPPETLEAQISKSNNMFDGQYFLVFAAKDDGSGLDYIEVKEGDEPWVKADSPYLLKNQNLNQNILIKAVDKNGNARTETLNLKQYQLIKKGVYAAILIILALAIWQVFRKKKPA